MKQFEITYSDGKIYSGETLSDWNGCPPTGVQCITVLHDDDSAQERIHGVDYYILDGDNQIIGTDLLLPGAVKEGELIAFDKFVLLKNSVVMGGPNPRGRPGSNQGLSKIWNRYPKTDTTHFTPGVRQGIVVED
jgi:hypothetical protein